MTQQPQWVIDLQKRLADKIKPDLSPKALIPALVPFSDLKFDQLFELMANDEARAEVLYDDYVQDLLIFFGDRTRESVVHYVSSNMGLLVDAETLEVVGLQIEAVKLQETNHEKSTHPGTGS